MKQSQRESRAQSIPPNPYNSNVLPYLCFQLPSMQDHIQIQVIRVHSLQKLNKIKQIFTLANQPLKHLLESYQPYKQLKIDIPHLKNSQKGKILKKNNSIYYGQTTDNKMNGKGILFSNEGRIYQGQFLDNEKSGDGYQIYPSGNVYIGQYERNHKHGHGVYFWFEASMKILEGCCSTEYYKGDWWGGMPSGNGIHHRLTGDVYEGQFKNGLKHGKGFQKYPNGDQYKGHYVNGLPEGYGEYQWKDKSIYKGDFRQGLRHGFGIWKQKQFGQSQQYQGHYLSDKKSGYGIYVWNKSQYYKGQFFEDKRHGFGELYQNNKLVYEGAWENGEKNSEIKYKRKPVYQQPSKLIQRVKMRTQGDEKVSPAKREFSALNKKAQLINESDYVTRDPKFKLTVKKNLTRSRNDIKVRRNSQNSIEGMSLNPQAVRMARQTSHYGKSGHKNCIPIDQYLSINKGLTKR